MKKKILSVILLLVVIFILTLALTACSRPVTSLSNLNAAALSIQINPTPAPPVEDQSEIGSTDEIFIMGIVIVMITSVPFLLHRLKK